MKTSVKIADLPTESWIYPTGISSEVRLSKHLALY